MKKLILVPILALAMFVGACGIAQWIKVAQQILPVVLPMVTNLVTAVGLLEGKTVTAADLNTITQVANQVSSDLNLVGQLVDQYQSSPNTTTVEKINTTLAEVSTNLNNLLPALHISDPATVQKITAIVELVSSEVTSLEQILPTVSSGNLTARQGAVLAPLNASELKKQYDIIVTQSTANSQVNQAFAGEVLK